MSEIAWTWVAVFGVTGVGMALLSCFVGLRPKVENPLWWLLYAMWVAVAFAVGIEATFRTILAASMLAGLLHGVTTALFLDSYLANNPWHAEKMQGPRGKTALMFVVMGLVIGTAFGAVVAGIAWGIGRL